MLAMEKTMSDAGSSVRCAAIEMPDVAAGGSNLGLVGASFPDPGGQQGACGVPSGPEQCEQNCGDVQSVATSGWTRRVRIGKAPIERAINTDWKSALEVLIRSYVDRKEGTVIDHVVGTTFDSLEESYEFYNLYSWEARVRY